MTTKEYAMAYTEVLEILRHVPDEDIAKIPKDKIHFYELNCDSSYEYKLDSSREFKDKKMLRITKAILANIYRDYWASSQEKEEIILREKKDIEEMERLKRMQEKSETIIDSQSNLQKNVQEEKITNDTIADHPAKQEKESIIKRIVKAIFGSIQKEIQ